MSSSTPSKDYREVEPFDVLVKVGPLRSKGWGSAPDATLSAPRFAKMVQIVWSGCGDEDDFGYDPAGIIAGGASAPASSREADRGGSRAIRWTRETSSGSETPLMSRRQWPMTMNSNSSTRWAAARTCGGRRSLKSTRRMESSIRRTRRFQRLIRRHTQTSPSAIACRARRSAKTCS